MISPFVVEIILADGTNVGTSTNILELNDTKSLDTIGSLSFSIPASDPLTEYINTGVTFEIYDKKDGYLGTYLFKNKELTEELGNAVLNVECYDILKELTYETVGFNRSYNYELVSTVVTDVVSVIDGWSIDVEDNLGRTVINYQGESVYRALDEQRDRNSAHFRLTPNASRQLEFGLFGDDSGYVFTNLRGQTSFDANIDRSPVVITSLTLVEESEEIYNKIIPLGHGQGVTQLNIANAVLGDYTILEGDNTDGSKYYYFEDTDSVNNYGRRTRVLTFPNLRPISNSDIDILNAKNALKLTAEAYIRNHLEPKYTYSVEVAKLPSDLNVGDTIDILYVNKVDQVEYININETFYVMDISKSRKADGTRSFKISISNLDDRRTSDQDVIIDVVRNLKDLNVHIPASITYSPIGPYVKRVKGDFSEINRIAAKFTARIRDEVLYLNRAILRIATSPLKSSVTTTASGGGSVETSLGGGDHGHIIGQLVNNTAGGYTTRRITMAMGNDFGSPNIVNADLAINATVSGTITDNYIITATASGDHTHDINIPSHTHDMVYDVFENTVYPQGLLIIIDGNDVTSELLLQTTDLTFAPSNAEYEYELDITSILNLNLKQNHTIEIQALAGSGEIECEVDCMVTVQPIII